MLAVIIVVFLQFFVSTRTPIKYALFIEDLADAENPYYLVQWTQVTGSSWRIIGDQNGYFENPQYIIIEGEAPSVVKNNSVATGENIYVCYGEYMGENEIANTGMIFDTYKFTDWDILYPVRRETILPSWFYPIGYLSKADFA